MNYDDNKWGGNGSLIFLVLLFFSISIYELVRLEVDEFGRSYVNTLIFSTGLSLARGLFMTLALFALAGVLVYLIEIRKMTWVKWIIQAIIDGLESIHVYAWILLAAGVYENNMLIIAIIFMIAGLPIVINILSGITRTITEKEYYKAAIALGVGDRGLVFRHVIPNITEPLIALGINVLGAAMAVYGATALFGAVNRQGLDLGIFLLRGKEQAPEDNGLLLATVSMYAAIYGLLMIFKKASTLE